MIRWCCVILCVALGLAGTLVPNLSAQGNQGSLNRKIDKEQIDLQQLRQEIRDAKRKKDRIQQQADEVLKTIEALDRQSVKKRKDYDTINRQLRKTDREIEEIEQDLKIKERQVNAKKKSVGTRLRLLYMEGRVGRLRPLLTTNSYVDFPRRLFYRFTIAHREHALFAGYRTDLLEVEHLKTRRVQTRGALLTDKKKTEKIMKELKRVRGNKHLRLASLNKKVEVLKAIEKTKENSLEAMLKEFEQSRKLAEARAPRRKGQRPEVGSLLWPAEGEVVTLFGRQKHPTFETYVNKKGIEIRTGEGSKIRAVSSGNVVYADWLKGYGLVVILDHNNG
ncbi:MAG: peptidoglycan DD-metalloendopeptidase family protein, partial [Nitrospirae bacterium]|nr:peptidoglycan DD-metalloendopeptidase family protein [Nitrospirota bacterium]